MPTASGGCWCRRNRYFSSSGVGFAASAVPSISSGAHADLAVTRFSGRRAPQHPGGIPNLPDWVTREAYSHEVSSCGFWPGGDPMATPLSTPMPIRSRRVMPARGSSRRKPFTAPTCTSSSCPTTAFANRPRRRRRCWRFCRRPMGRPPIWATGIERRWSRISTRDPAPDFGPRAFGIGLTQGVAGFIAGQD